MTPEEIAALPPVKPEPVRTCVSAVCLLSRRMLGSLDRRSLLESVQAVRGRYMHVRTGNARPQPAVPTGAGLKKNLRLLLARWPACDRARSRPPHHTPAARVVQPPAARRSSHALRRKWIGVIAAMSLRRYVAAPLGRYAAMSPRRYVATPLRRFVATPLCLFAAASLCREVRTRVCDGRALCMCVSVVACTGVGTCVARPRPQSTFANGWASGS